MARHRDEVARRGISRGPVIAVVVVLALVLVTAGWFRVRNNVDEQGQRAAATCVDGRKVVDVAADPDIAPALSTIAGAYNASRPVVRDQCVSVVVHPLRSSVVLAGLTKGWDTAKLGPAPAAWVASDAGFTIRLGAAAPDQLDGDPTSVASSPLVLAVAQDAGPKVTATGLSWAQLPAVVGKPDGWKGLGEPSWGALTVALPTGSAENPAAGETSAPEAAQAVAAGLEKGAKATVTPQATTALAALGGAVKTQPVGTAAALEALTALRTVAGSPYQAVPATEQQVFASAKAAPGTVSAAVLAGPAPAEDYPYAALTGPAVDDTQSRAASAFAQLVTSAAGRKTLVAAGFRTRGGPAPAATPAVAFGPAPATLTRADPATADRLTAALRTPAVTSRTLVVLNTSTSMGTTDGPASRLKVTAAALAARVQALPDSASVGLATFVRGLGGSRAYAGLVPTKVLDTTHRAEVGKALDELVVSDATSADSSLVAAYRDAVRGFVAGAPNRLVVITDGPNDNGETDAGGIRAALKAASQDGKPVQVDVVALSGQDIGGLTDMADATGGTVIRVPGAASPELGAAFMRLLP
ncbi:MAG: hypothetical protein ABI181_10585 [Mycobacteriaceae bacterium]